MVVTIVHIDRIDVPHQLGHAHLNRCTDHQLHGLLGLDSRLGVNQTRRDTNLPKQFRFWPQGSVSLRLAEIGWVVSHVVV